MTSSQRMGLRCSVAALVQEVHERGLEVPWSATDRALELGRGAGEEQLAVDEHEHAVA